MGTWPVHNLDESGNPCSRSTGGAFTSPSTRTFRVTSFNLSFIRCNLLKQSSTSVGDMCRCRCPDHSMLDTLEGSWTCSSSTAWSKVDFPTRLQLTDL